MGVHFTDKARVAERLALASQALMYNSTLPNQGPRIIVIIKLPIYHISFLAFCSALNTTLSSGLLM